MCTNTIYKALLVTEGPVVDEGWLGSRGGTVDCPSSDMMQALVGLPEAWFPRIGIQASNKTGALAEVAGKNSGS